MPANHQDAAEPSSPAVRSRPTDHRQPEQRMLGVPVRRVREESVEETTDVLAVEEPLEIRVAYVHDGAVAHRAVSITMRTPGHDADLACGFLFTEGILHRPEQIAEVGPCGVPTGRLSLRNTVRVTLTPEAQVDLKRLERHFYTNSSCGVCGKSSLQALHVAGVRPIGDSSFTISRRLVYGLPDRLREAQDVFEQTGALHAAGLFDPEGALIALREDVGRHNAVDKLIGNLFRSGRCPLDARVLMLSGRASFELIQKALVAGVPIVAAVGAPSTLAVELARENRMTLLGFVRGRRFNVYCGAERLSS